jgi:hypothetical protein
VTTPLLADTTPLLPKPTLHALLGSALLGVALVVSAMSAAWRVIPLSAESLERLATNRADLLDEWLPLNDDVLTDFRHQSPSQYR